MANPLMESAQETIEDELQKNKLTHLKVRIHGSHLVIYSEDEGEKVNRARLTVLQAGTYQLSMSNHRGRWEATPYTGSLSEMLSVLTRQFPFMLAEW